MIRVTAMNRKRFVGDWAMLGTVFGLILFGLLMIYSASNYTARLHMGMLFIMWNDRFLPYFSGQQQCF